MPFSDNAPKILIAEDNVVEQIIIAGAIKRFGYVPVMANDGLEAWSILQQPNSPQIALINWMMPGLDGPELCQRLKARKKSGYLHVIFVTGKNRPEDIVAGLEAGADDFIGKPWHPAELRARLNVAIRFVQLQNRFADHVVELQGLLSESHKLLNEHNLNIDQASRLLRLVNSGTPRWVGLNDELTLHIASQSGSRARVGGDHFWAKTQCFPGRGQVTSIAVRDQSGSDIQCILRSIASDLVHVEALKDRATLEQQMRILNDRLCASGMFEDDDFLTALTLELDHASLRLAFISCGHPPLLLIRDGKVTALPAEGTPGRNLPIASLPGQSFTAGCCELQPRDRMILYTDGLEALAVPQSGRALDNAEIQRLAQSLVDSHPAIPVSKLVIQLIHAASGKNGGLNGSIGLRDDVTVIGLEIEDDAAGNERIYRFDSVLDIDNLVPELSREIIQDCGGDIDPTSLRLLLDEALANAWLHGNNGVPQSPVRLRWSRQNSCAIQIEDDGPGFSVGQVIDPCSPEGLLSDHGRGMFIIKQISEWVQWKSNGKRLAVRMPLAQPAAKTR